MKLKDQRDRNCAARLSTVYDAIVPGIGVLRCAVLNTAFQGPLLPRWDKCEGAHLDWRDVGTCMQPHPPEWINFYSNAAARRSVTVSTPHGFTMEPTHKKTAFTAYRQASARGAAATAGRR